MKHIDVRYHFIREFIEDGHILLKKIATKDNPMNMLNKVVPVSKFSHYKNVTHIFSVRWLVLGVLANYDQLDPYSGNIGNLVEVQPDLGLSSSSSDACVTRMEE